MGYCPIVAFVVALQIGEWKEYEKHPRTKEKIIMYDCGFSKENNWFRYRTGGFLIHDDKMLFVKSKIGNYYYMIGGGVHLGESSKQCIEREIYEESGIRAKVDYLAVVCENFFKGKGGIIDGFDCHTLEFYYRMTMPDGEFEKCKSSTDDNEELVWLKIDEIEHSEIKPTFIKERIIEILTNKTTLHIIEERDR